ncbi:MAG: tyrosine-type recombinase/integrase [Candidatus Schekmanbacteria bacterium]|nr:tyrosine-type recombinase/integrase [Candidatus Schekmanbacteria bacterium]
MALCMIGLGLRAVEVATLSLDDIDWRAGVLKVRADKTRRTDLMPLPDRVGRAMVAYLRQGRPSTVDRHVFVRHRLPRSRPIEVRIVQGALRRDMLRAGLPVQAPHKLRHGTASRLLESGASIKEVADMLRNRSLDTTTIYLKIDTKNLSQVAMPWPEVHS